MKLDSFPTYDFGFFARRNGVRACRLDFVPIFAAITVENSQVGSLIESDFSGMLGCLENLGRNILFLPRHCLISLSSCC
jgi:hypothetical protein